MCKTRGLVWTTGLYMENLFKRSTRTTVTSYLDDESCLVLLKNHTDFILRQTRIGESVFENLFILRKRLFSYMRKVETE